jgi:hypothetical protein
MPTSTPNTNESKKRAATVIRGGRETNIGLLTAIGAATTRSPAPRRALRHPREADQPTDPGHCVFLFTGCPTRFTPIESAHYARIGSRVTGLLWGVIGARGSLRALCSSVSPVIRRCSEALRRTQPHATWPSGRVNRGIRGRGLRIELTLALALAIITSGSQILGERTQKHEYVGHDTTHSRGPELRPI